MVNRTLALFAMGMIAMSATSSAAIEDRVGKLDFGVVGGGAFNNNDVDDAGFVGGGLSYGVTEWLAIGIEGGWQEADTEAANNETVGNAQLFGDIILRAPWWFDNFVPYAVFGLGGVWTYVTNEPPASATLQGNDVDDSSFGFKVGGGFDFFLNEKWAATFEAAYITSDPDLPGTSIVNEDVDYATVVGGIKYVF